MRSVLVLICWTVWFAVNPMNGAAFAEFHKIDRPTNQFWVNCPINCGLKSRLDSQSLYIRRRISGRFLEEIGLCSRSTWSSTIKEFEDANFVRFSTWPYSVSRIVIPWNHVRLKVGNKLRVWHVFFNRKIELHIDDITMQVPFFINATKGCYQQIVASFVHEKAIRVPFEHFVKLGSYSLDPLIYDLPKLVFPSRRALYCIERSSRCRKSVEVIVGRITSNSPVHHYKHFVSQWKNFAGVKLIRVGNSAIRSDDESISSELHDDNCARRNKAIISPTRKRGGSQYCKRLAYRLHHAPVVVCSRDGQTVWINAHSYNFLQCPGLFLKGKAMKR